MIHGDDMKDMRSIVAFTGKAGCGKSTAADVLVEMGWTRVKFASPLKDMCRALGLTEEQIEGADKERVINDLGVTPRWIMQTLGTDWGRKLIHPDLWVAMAKTRIEQATGNVVVDDCRFENEAQVIRDLGGQVVGITRADLADTGSHESEKGVASDWNIANDFSTSEEWKKAVLHVFANR